MATEVLTEMTSEELDQIVAELKAGINVEENFHRLFDRFYGPVYRFFADRGMSADECLDLTQEAFLRVHRSIQAYRGEAGFEAWLFGIVVNLYRNFMRRRHLLARSALRVSLDEEPADTQDLEIETQDPEINALEHERINLLERAISDLPPQMRRALILSVHHGLKYREVADLLGLTVETVKSHLFQGRRRLRQALRKLDDVVE